MENMNKLKISLAEPNFIKENRVEQLRKGYDEVLDYLTKAKKSLIDKYFTQELKALESALLQLRKQVDSIKNNGLALEIEKLSEQLIAWETKLTHLDKEYEEKCKQEQILADDNQRLALEFKSSKCSLLENLKSLSAIRAVNQSSLDLKIAIEEETKDFIEIRLIYFARTDKENENFYAIFRQYPARNYWTLEDMCPKSQKFDEIAKLLYSTADIQGCVATIRAIFLEMKK